MEQEKVEIRSEVSVSTKRISVWAVVAFVLGLLTVCLGPLGLIPIVLGIVAIIKIRANPFKRGQELAIAAIVLGCVGLASTFLWYLIGAGYRDRALMYAQVETSFLTETLVQYAESNGYQFPLPDSWLDELVDSEYIDQYAVDSWVDHDQDGVVYEYVPDCEFGNPDLILIYLDPDHFREGVLTGFADGHVDMPPHDEFQRRLAEQSSESLDPVP